MRFEQDEVTLLGGVRHGRTLGSPVAIEIGNTEWVRSDKWHEEMSPAPGADQGAAHPGPARPRRPGRHAEVRLHRRPRRARAGQRPRDRGPGGGRRAWPSCCSATLGIESSRHVIQMGPARAEGRRPARRRPTSTASTTSPVRCFDPAAEEAMIAEIKAAAKEGDSLGGVVEVLGYGVPVGLGSHVHWDRKLDAPAGPGAHEHPGREGRGDRRRLRGRRPAGQRGPRPDRAGTPTPASYRRESHARRRASRAACPPASCSWCGRR